MSLENPEPKLYEAYQLQGVQKKIREEAEDDDELHDPFDELEIFEIIRHINDPEYPLTLEQLNVLNLERIYLKASNYVEVYFTPTIPHCSMAQMIGLMVKVKLSRFLPRDFKTRVLITPGTHVNEP